MNEEEQDLEDAEAAFRDEEAENNQQILIALGFTPHYHDKDPEGNDETNFGIRVMNTKIGVKFNPENPTGKAWAYILAEDGKKDFIKNGDLNKLPLVQRYLNIQTGKKPIPEATVTGRIIEKRSKSVAVEIEEDGEKKEVIFGWGAVKKHEDGSHFIPLGFSKPSTDNPDGKMYVPRNILLPELDPQPGEAPAATTIPPPAAAGVNQPELPPPEQKLPPRTPKATQAELITKYLDIVVQVTKVVKENEGISERERGYVTNWICNAVKDELEKGGSHKEA